MGNGALAHPGSHEREPAGRDLRRLAFCILFGDGGGRAEEAFHRAMLGLIGLNILAVILETEPTLHLRYGAQFAALEIFSVAVFSLEYLARLWACTCGSRYAGPIAGRIRYVLTPMALVDLAAVLPFYLPLIGCDLRFLHAARLFRILKMGRYSDSARTLGRVLHAKRAELGSMLFAMCVVLILASGLMYVVEHAAQPEAFASIVDAMWWGVATLTTVGYGDIYPLTAAGKVLGGAISVLGIGMFALPAGVIAWGFAEEVQRRQMERKVCPHCGAELEVG